MSSSPTRKQTPKRTYRWLLTFTAIAFIIFQQLVLTQPTVVQAVSPNIVISQVYGGGGNSGATFKNDFIELYNRGSVPASLNGWSVQYASATGTGNFGVSGQITALPNVTLNPGQYFLIQEAGGTTGAALPPADLIAPATQINMAGAAGKVALVNTTTPLGCNGSAGQPCSAAALATIVDLVGYGNANFFEGTGAAPTLTNSTAAIRQGGGNIDTDNNNLDFAAATPTPRNSFNGGTALSINDVSQVEGDSGTITFNFTVSLSAPAPIGGVTFDIATADGTAKDGVPPSEVQDYVAKSLTAQTIPQNSQTYIFSVVVNGDTTIEPTENFFVNVTNVSGAVVTDGQGQGTITTDDVLLTGICQIQGSGTASPLVGQSVTTRGIVTGIKAGSSGGFYIQDDACDADPETSNGVFVFTGSSVPAGAVIGNRVQVSGTVADFTFSTDPNSPPLTEISGPLSVSVLSTGNTLPAPVVLTAAETTAASETANPLDTLEEYEGMRVTVPSMTVVAPTDGNITEPSATVSSTGVFYGVVTGVARPFREAGINVSDPLPAGAPATIPRFDENPEKIRVDSDGQPGTAKIDVAAGTIITNVTGPLDYSFRAYTILPDAATPPVIGTQPGPTPAPLATAGEFTVASFNMERFFDTNNDPTTSDPVLTAAAFNKRLAKASLIIRTIQRLPDVIGVEEVENLSTLQAVANQVNTEEFASSGIDPQYQAFLVEGNDIGGIDVGFLVKSSRISVVDVTQYGKTDTYTTPSSTQEILNDRPPLLLRATVARPGGGTLPFTVIVNHLRSLSGIDDPADGNRIRTKRRAQAEFLANLIQARQLADPTEKIISVGDYNAFNVNDGFVDVMGTIEGTPTPASQVTLASPDLVNPDLTDLVNTLPADQQYSFTFDGSAQVLDHVLVNDDALASLTRFAYARFDSDFPVIYYADGTRPERISDHDSPIAYFAIPPVVADLSLTKSASPDPVVTGSDVTYTLTVTNNGTDDATNVTVTDSLPSGTSFVNCSSTGAGICGGTGNTRTVTFASLAANTTETITITATVDCSLADGATIANTASVNSSTTDTNHDNNSAGASVTASNPAPVITAPPDKTVSNDTDSCSATLNPGTATATDNCGTPAIAGVRSDAQALNAPYPVGTTTITWTATDAGGGSDSAVQTITVNDTQAPTISVLSVDKPSLSPPNHKMVDVAVNYTAMDNCGPVTTTLFVTSNEPDNGLGDGDTANDIEVVNNHLVRLRAERSGTGIGRVYTITVTATDSHGNTRTRSVTVIVPKGK